MTSLVYAPLKPSNREIRVLELRSGTWSDAISCGLKIVSLNGDPAYEVPSGKASMKALLLTRLSGFVIRLGFC